MRSQDHHPPTVDVCLALNMTSCCHVQCSIFVYYCVYLQWKMMRQLTGHMFHYMRDKHNYRRCVIMEIDKGKNDHVVW